MANDQTNQKRILQEAEDRARRQDIRTRIANAQRIEEFLALDELTTQQKDAIPLARSEEELSTILGQLHINEQHELWLALQDWPYRDMPVPVEPPPSQTGANQPPSPGGGVTGLAAGAALGLIIPHRDPGYEDFKKDSEEYAEKMAKEWEKKPDYRKAADRQEIYDRAKREKEDMRALYDPKLAERWATKYGDSGLASALDRRKIQYDKISYEEFKETSRQYAERAASDWDKNPDQTKAANRQEAYNGAERDIHDVLTNSTLSEGRAKKWAGKHGDPALKAAIEKRRLAEQGRKSQTRKSRIIRRIFRRQAGGQSPPPNVFSGTGAPNTLSGVGPTNVLLGARPPTQTPRKPGFKDKLKSLARWPLPKTAMAPPVPKGLRTSLGRRNSLRISRVVNKRARERVGKFLLKFLGRGPLPKTAPAPPASLGLRNRLRASRAVGQRVRNRVKKFLDPTSYLTRFFARTLISSAIGAVAGFFASILSFAVGAFISFIAGVTGLATATIALVVSAVGWPVTLALAILLILVMLFTFLQIPCFFFCGPDGEPPQESPYPGIDYGIGAPKNVNNGEDIRYDILLRHDSAVADYAIEDITLYSLIPPGTLFVSATGNHDLSEPGKISWKLYPENKTTQTDETIVKTFIFTLTVDPDDDIKAENTLSIDVGSPGGGDLAPNDNLCQGNVYDYVTQNYLLPKNYGDPGCTLDTPEKKDQLYALLQQKDPQWVDFWFDIVIPGESGYRPNAWGLPVPDEEDPRDVLSDTGAWGLFQMGSTDPPGKLTNRKGTYRGDLTWPEQINTAIARNKYLDGRGLLFKYWQVAIEYCRSGRLNEPPCRDM